MELIHGESEIQVNPFCMVGSGAVIQSLADRGIKLFLQHLYEIYAGWEVSNGALTANICLAIALVVIGFLLYKESISIRQVAGILVCGIGLFLISG